VGRDVRRGAVLNPGEGPPAGITARRAPLAYSAKVQVRVLGPAAAERDGTAVDLGAPKQRGLLAALALHAGRAVTADTLVDLLWGDAAPPAATASLQTYVAGLRRVLEPGRAPRAASAVVPATSLGYALDLPPEALDAARFATTVEAVHRRLARPAGALPEPPAGADAAALRRELDEALAAWRGTPYADLRDSDAVRAERARLEALRLMAVEDRALLRLALGEHAAVAAELEPLVREEPLREGLRALHALALARSGRQGEALAQLRAVRRELARELGVDPGAGLRAVEAEVLGAPTATRPPRPARPAGPAPTTARPGDWPLVGRAVEVAALDAVLDAAAAGAPAAALVVGEAGVGKSRLLREVTARAAARGFAVATGRGSRDDGAPPLWPWTALLRDLGTSLPTSAAGGEAARFEVWEGVAGRLAAAARERPLLAVLDDLHWADTSSVKLLTHLLDTLDPAGAGRLALLVARRSHPEPTGALAELGEALARRGATRLDLTGLGAGDVAALAGAVLGAQPPGEDEAAAMHERTGGNPFLVTELVRLGTGGAVPAAVTDVVASRLDRLPEETRSALRTAAVVGRRFDLRLLAAATGGDEDRVLDALEPALAEGVVAEDGAEVFRFSHDLLHEAVYATLPATRRARRHAAVAAALEGLPGRPAAEAARHWLAAGPSSAGRAWRAAVAAAREARALQGWDEWAGLLGAAVEAQTQDAGVTARERYDLLLERADACRRIADRESLDAALVAAVEIAEGLGDVQLVALAAVGPTELFLWHHRAYGEVREDVLRRLRDVLRRLPADDAVLRCRVMLALANELRFGGAPQERAALVEQGLAIARRLGDPALVVWACVAGCTALWHPASAELRHGLANEALAAAAATGDVEHEAVARAMVAVTAQETGRIDLMRREIVRARAVAEAAGLVMPVVILGWLEIPWLALEGRFADAQRLFAETLTRWRRTSMPQRDETPAGTAMAMAMAADAVDDAMVTAIEAGTRGSRLPMDAPLLATMLRAGRREEARRRYAEHGIDLDRDNDQWISLLRDCMAAEVAFGLGDRALGARTYELLAPYAGLPCSSGSATALGPVDGWLALAAAATGDSGGAARHAADAFALASDWRIPAYTAWLERVLG
jgi:DNA-binding SARP family transcriptional activator